MHTPKRLRTHLLAFGLVLILQPLQAFAQQSYTASRISFQTTPAGRDGQHDFDFEIGTWKTQLSRLQRPLTGSTTWLKYEGTTVVRKVLGGRAVLVELVADGTAGHYEGLALRLYDAQARQWSLNFAGANSGMMSTPTIGAFKNGRGEFYSHETYDGRTIFVRFIISDITPDSCRFEQAFSDDGGKTWEVNWIVTDTRVKEPKDQRSRLEVLKN
ncbi:MAG TPA: hypothetical protein VJT82_00925 [Pyrinomonadaceae bacterium]|nr:hypothetical protein [Pyrinomonadaceae bacterium]